MHLMPFEKKDCCRTAVKDNLPMKLVMKHRYMAKIDGIQSRAVLFSNTAIYLVSDL